MRGSKRIIRVENPGADNVESFLAYLRAQKDGLVRFAYTVFSEAVVHVYRRPSDIYAHELSQSRSGSPISGGYWLNGKLHTFSERVNIEYQQQGLTRD